MPWPWARWTSPKPRPARALHATGGHAVYTAGPDGQVELTGHPWAQTDKLTILDADRLKYQT